MTDRRLSTRPPCDHSCCKDPDDETHLHLFPTGQCPSCRILSSLERHPSTGKKLP